ncbi:hypothetical protein D3C78_171080 [compost metagenome]
MFWPRLTVGIRLLNLLRLFRQYTKHICLANRFRFRVLVSRFQRVTEGVHQRRAMRAEAVKRPGHNQFFQYSTVQFFGISSGAKIEQFAEITAIVTRVDDRFDWAFAHAFDSTDTVNYFTVVVDVEMVHPGVNIRRQDFQPHTPAFIDQANHFLGVIHISGHYRRHKFCRIVRFQPQGLIRNQRISSGVRFVKSITGEFLHQVEDFHCQLTVYATAFRALFKGAALLGHLLRLFLTHRTTQHIRAAKGIAGKLLGNLHHLFLVQDNTVRWLKNRFQALMLPLNVRVGDFFATVLTVDKVIYHP